MIGHGTFDIPVVLFIFKRTSCTLKIIERLREVRVKKIYLIADAGRTPDEQILVDECRDKVLNAIDWECEVIRNFADVNRGVYNNIGLGADWVFSQEEEAIFLEDDNLPELSFFDYCAEMLQKFRNNDEVFWICGTNYLEDLDELNQSSYYLTKSLLPCGWASWSKKYRKYYDKDFSRYLSSDGKREFRKSYSNRWLRLQQKLSIDTEILRRRLGYGYASWDYQVVSTIRCNRLFGIMPSRNQIKNIGVDAMSIHGGNSMEDEMTKRFCGIDSYPLRFPLIHLGEDCLDDNVEKRIDQIILQPISYRLKSLVRYFLLLIKGKKK